MRGGGGREAFMGEGTSLDDSAPIFFPHASSNERKPIRRVICDEMPTNRVPPYVQIQNFIADMNCITDVHLTYAEVRRRLLQEFRLLVIRSCVAIEIDTILLARFRLKHQWNVKKTREPNQLKPAGSDDPSMHIGIVGTIHSQCGV